jgi:hypothetical protein
VSLECARKDFVTGETTRTGDLRYGFFACKERRSRALEAQSLGVLLWRFADCPPECPVKVKWGPPGAPRKTRQ